MVCERGCAHSAGTRWPAEATGLSPGWHMHERVEAFRHALEDLDQVRADALFAEALRDEPPIAAVEHLVVPALEQIGEAWCVGDLALSQVYMSGRYCERLVDRILPPSDPERKHQPRAAIVTLADCHELGKRLVYASLRAAGYELFDFGTLEVEPLVARVLAERIEVLLVSALMLPSALKVAELTRQLHQLAPGLRVIVGGAPFLFDEELWREVGADAMGRDAGQAVTMLEAMMNGGAK